MRKTTQVALLAHRPAVSSLKCLPAFALAVLCAVAVAQDAPCKQAMVVYKEPPLELTAKVKLSTEVSGSYDATQRNGSAQGTRWFVEKKPDYMQAGPWSTTIVVGNSSDNKTILRIDVFDHGNNFHAKWLNEKLIFIEVWWGRVYASDLIVDVEKKRIVYHEVGDYLALTFCKE